MCIIWGCDSNAIFNDAIYIYRVDIALRPSACVLCAYIMDEEVDENLIMPIFLRLLLITIFFSHPKFILL